MFFFYCDDLVGEAFRRGLWYVVRWEKCGVLFALDGIEVVEQFLARVACLYFERVESCFCIVH